MGSAHVSHSGGTGLEDDVIFWVARQPFFVFDRIFNTSILTLTTCHITDWLETKNQFFHQYLLHFFGTSVHTSRTRVAFVVVLFDIFTIVQAHLLETSFVHFHEWFCRYLAMECTLWSSRRFACGLIYEYESNMLD